MSWQDEAACKGADPDLFFPEEADFEQVRSVKEQYCDVCPVKQQCLAMAMAEPGTVGVHGGMLFPLVGPIPYTMQLLRTEGLSWDEVAEITGHDTGHTAASWVHTAFNNALKRSREGLQVVGGRRMSPSVQGSPPDDLEGKRRWVAEQRARGCGWEDIAKPFGRSPNAVKERYAS
jgi:hypothetical protein